MYYEELMYCLQRLAEISPVCFLFLNQGIACTWYKDKKVVLFPAPVQFSFLDTGDWTQSLMNASWCSTTEIKGFQGQKAFKTSLKNDNT